MLLLLLLMLRCLLLLLHQTVFTLARVLLPSWVLLLLHWNACTWHLFLLLPWFLLLLQRGTIHTLVLPRFLLVLLPRMQLLLRLCWTARIQRLPQVVVVLLLLPRGR